MSFKGLFIPSISIDAGIEARVDTWKGYIDFNHSIYSISINTSVKNQKISGLIQ